MIILTDNIEFAQACISGCEQWREQSISNLETRIRPAVDTLFDAEKVLVCDQVSDRYWDYLFAIDNARQSQYDVLSRLAVSECPPPDRILCCAAEGRNFHGFKNRHWQVIRGNIHLSAYIRPERQVAGDSAGFIVAAAMAVLQTVRSFDLRAAEAGIKWVNDVLIENKKVGGVLARLQKLGEITESAVIGVGLNVSESPGNALDSFVQGVAAIADFAHGDERCRHIDAFPRLVSHLGMNLETLVHGGYPDLLMEYRKHSLVLGREAGIFRDSSDSPNEMIASGRVKAIGDSLELFIEGIAKPLTNGRLKLI